MKKITSLVVLTALLTLTFVPSGFGANQWVARSKGNHQQVLWQDGSITKGDPKTAFHKEENRCHSAKQNCQEPLDISLWQIGSQGSSHTYWHVTYLSSTLWTADQIIVYYDLTTATVLSAIRQIQEPDGSFTTTDLSVDSLTLAPYCTGTYGCIGG